MLQGMNGARILQRAAKAGYHKDMLLYLEECLFVALVVTVVSIMRFIVDGYVPWWLMWSAWGGLVGLLLAMIMRNAWVLFYVFERFTEEQKTSRVAKLNGTDDK